MKNNCSLCNEEVVEKAISNLPQNHPQAVRACFAAAKFNNKKNVTYSNEWVYECILLRIKSKKTYNHLRSHNILALPTIETVNRYIKIIKDCYGFQMSILEILKKKQQTWN